MNTSVRYLKKPTAKLDSLNNRYIISPLSVDGTITVGAILRAIKSSTHLSWRDIADWCGIRDSSDAFKLAFTKSLRKERARLSEYITISGNDAYFYDQDHKPVSPTATVRHASITNGEKDVVSVTANRAAKFATRITVLDTEDRALKLTISAVNGYVSSTDDDITIQNKAVVTVTGGTKKINSLLRALVIVCPKTGEASVKFVLDDLTGGVDALSTTEVPILVSEEKAESVPELTIPASVTAKLAADTVLTPAITVSDDDNKELELHITPFGCNIFGFKNNIHAVTPGTMYITSGTPDNINADIAQMSVYAYQESAQIAYELVCNGTKIRKYLVLTVSSGETAAPAAAPTPAAAPKVATVKVARKSSSKSNKTVNISTEETAAKASTETETEETKTE